MTPIYSKSTKKNSNEDSNNVVILEAIKKATLWLAKQQVPNSVVKENVRKGLILSYDTPKEVEGYKYTYSRSSLYDNALALIAFTMTDYRAGAWDIYNGLKKAAPDGLFYFNYNTHNAWPSSKDRSGALIRNGASAWMLFALGFFLEFNIKLDSKFAQTKKGAELISYIHKVAGQILNFQIKADKSERNGFITGGWGNYKLVINQDKKKIEETFEDKKIEWVSVEHSIDLYFAFKKLFDLSKKNIESFKSYKALYEFMKENLTKGFWNNDLKQFNRGWGQKKKDDAEALDAASWGAIYLKSIGEVKKARTALSKTRAYENWRSKPRGHLPYINMLVHEDFKINQFFYPKRPLTHWGELDFNWWEGTFGVLLANLKVHGRSPSMKNLFKDYLVIQNQDGSFNYGTKDIPFQFASYPSVASTAWFIISMSCYLVEEVNESFWN